MSSGAKTKAMGKRATLKAQAYNLYEKLGSTVLSMALVLSMVPAPAIAYAVGEDEPSTPATTAPAEGEPVETPAESQTPETPADTTPTPTNQTTDEPTAGTNEGTDQTSGSGNNQTTDTTTNTTDGTKPTDGGTNTVNTPTDNPNNNTPSTDDENNTTEGEDEVEPVVTEEIKGVDSEPSFIATAQVDAGDLTLKDKVLYAQSSQDVNITLECNRPDRVTDVQVSSVSADGLTFTKNDADGFKWIASTTSEAGTYDLSSLTVTYTYTYTEKVITTKTNPTTGDVIEQTEKDGDSKTSDEATTNAELSGSSNVTSVCIDKTKPVVTAWIDRVPAETAEAETTGTTQTRYFDLSNGGTVAFKLSVDEEHIDWDKSKLYLAWFDEGGNAVGTAQEISFGADKTATTASFGASDFIAEDGSLLYAVVTYSVEDYAQNSKASGDGTEVSTFRFTSESAWLEDVGIEIVKPDGVAEATDTAGATTYNGSVEAKATGTYLDKLTVKVTDVVDGVADELASSENSYLIEAGDKVKESHAVSAFFTTPHIAAGKTVSQSSVTDPFYIDTTVPELTDDSVVLGGNHQILEDVYYYQTKDDPTLTITPKEGTGSTLDLNGEPYTFTCFDGEGNKIKAKKFSVTKTSVDGESVTYSIAVPEVDKAYRIVATPKTIFGTDVDDSAETPFFVIDGEDPKVNLSFSGPGVLLDGVRAGFYKFWNDGKATSQYEVGEIGVLTITVEDSSLKTVTITGVKVRDDSLEAGFKELEGPQQPQQAGKYQLEVPYVQEDGKLYFIGEGEGLSIEVVAEDNSGKKTTYTYNSESANDSTELPVKATDDKFDIDVTPVSYDGFDIAEADTIVDGDIHLYDKSSVEGTITVSDKHFDPQNSIVTVTAEGSNSKQTFSDWTQDGNSWSTKVTLNEDTATQQKGTRVLYSIALSANDKLGNQTTEVTVTDGYTIALDTQAPVVSISSADPVQQVAGIDYYDEAFDATITATDPFFDATNSPVTPVGGSVTQEWKNDGKNTYTCIVHFDENTTFDSDSLHAVPSTLGVETMDLLEHPTNRYYKDKAEAESDSFIVDLTDPVVDSVTYSIGAVGAYEDIDYYVDHDVVATITVTDRNFDATSTEAPSTVVPVEGTWDGKWEHQGDGTYTTTVTYKQTPVDKKANFTINAKDCAQRTAKEKTTYKEWNTNDANDFVVDTDKPNIEVTFDKNPVGAYNSVDYYSEKPTATIKVTDNNFDPKNSIIKPTGGAITQEWTQDGNVWTAYVEFGENREGDYANVKRSTLEIAYCDKAYTASKNSIDGHNGKWTYSDLATSQSGVFVVDLTAPTVHVDVNQPIQTTFDNKDFYNNDVTMTVTVKDNNLDLASPLKPKHGKDSGAWKSNDERTYTRTVTYAESQNISDPSDLAAEVYDLVYTASGKKVSGHDVSYDYRSADGKTTVASGPRAVGSSATGFIIDKTAPNMNSVHVQSGNADAYATATGAGIQFFNQAIAMKYFFADPCGLDTVELTDPDQQYVIAKGQDGFARGATANSVTVKQFVERTTQKRDMYERDIKLIVTDITGNWRVWTIAPTGEVKSTNAGNASNVPINNISGNYPNGLVQDTVAPRVSVGPKSLEGGFYNTTQSVTTTIEEFNFNYLQRFDPSRTVVRITKYEGNAGRAMSVIEIPASAFGGSGSSWSQTQAFADDGHYIVEAQFKDFANNLSNLDKIGEFTIDKTPPVINSITYDNNDVRNGHYYKAARTATITITEHNWDSSLVHITTNGTFNGWVDNGDVHVGTVSFSTDGDYNLSISLSDKAGNSAQKSEPDFTIDLTAPKLEFMVNGEKVETDSMVGAFNEEISPEVIYTDEKNYDVNGISWKMTGNKRGDKTDEYAFSRTSNDGSLGETVTYSDFENEVEVDDIYTFEASILDLAGNEAKGQIEFSVNRFGSNFIVLTPGDDALDEHSGYLAEQPLVQVKEINVSGVAEDEKTNDELQTASVTHGLDTDILKKQDEADDDSKGFYVEHIESSNHNDDGYVEYGWSEYRYNVYKPNFGDDGSYSVVVSSTDTATNRNNSNNYYNPDEHEVAGAEVEFMLDTHAPVIDNINFEEGQKYNHGKEEYENLTFTVTDNIQVSDVVVSLSDEEGGGNAMTVEAKLNGKKPKVTVNGNPVDAAQIVQQDGKEYSFTVPVEAESFTKRSLSIAAYDLAANEAGDGVGGFRNTSNIFELYWPAFLALLAALAAGGGAYAASRNRSKDEGDAN